MIIYSVLNFNKQNEMSSKNSVKSKGSSVDSAKKMKILSELLLKAQELGFQVRKEKLKQGHGWRCMSGACLLKGEKILFLDSKMSLDEQVYFLSSWLAGGAQSEQVAA